MPDSILEKNLNELVCSVSLLQAKSYTILIHSRYSQKEQAIITLQ